MIKKTSRPYYHYLVERLFILILVILLSIQNVRCKRQGQPPQPPWASTTTSATTRPPPIEQYGIDNSGSPNVQQPQQQKMQFEIEYHLKEIPRLIPKRRRSKASGGGSGGDHHNDHADHEMETMSSSTAVANVLADLCPHGMLPIAYGMAAAGGTGPVLATIILIVFGVLSWYSLVSFARAAEVVLVQQQKKRRRLRFGGGNIVVKLMGNDVFGSGGPGEGLLQQQRDGNNSNDDDDDDEAAGAGESLSAVWARILPNGKLTTAIPDLGCVFLTIGCLLFYSAFIGDLFGSLASSIPGIPDFLKKRSSVLLLLHTIPILPLCLKKDLSALKYSSMIGLVGVFYTIFFVGIRLIDKSYNMGGKYYALMPNKLHPMAPMTATSASSSAGSKSILGYLVDVPPFHVGRGLLVLMNMCCVAYACHYNAVKYYMELKDRTIPTLKGVMAAGIGGTATVFWLMMILGFATFGSNSQTLILNHYHPTDSMAIVARTFTGIAIISGYALMFAGLKAALFSLTKLDRSNVKNKTEKQNIISTFVLACIAISACFVTEHELATVIGIVGSIFGSIVIYIFPALINNNLLQMKDKKTGNTIAIPFFKGEEIFNNVMLVFGVIFAILGTWISLQQEP